MTVKMIAVPRWHSSGDPVKVEFDPFQPLAIALYLLTG